MFVLLSFILLFSAVGKRGPYCTWWHADSRTSVGLSSKFKLKNLQTATAGILYRQNNNKRRGRHPELLTLLAESTDSYKGSVWWRELDKWRERKRRRDNMMKREAGRIPQWHSWCSRCSRPASNSARRLSFCLPACHPIWQFSRDRETARGAERSREEQRWARWCRGGTREISGAQALPVKSDMTFWFCHLSPTAMSDSALRSACHPPLLSSASISLSLRLSECLCLFLSPAPTPSPSFVLLFFPELQFYGGKVEVWLSGGVEV